MAQMQTRMSTITDLQFQINQCHNRRGVVTNDCRGRGGNRGGGVNERVLDYPEVPPIKHHAL